MRRSEVTGFEVLHADLGWRSVSFLKLTAGGMTGWAEFNEAFGAPGLGRVVELLRPRVLGADPMRVNAVVGELTAYLAPAASGMNRMAIGAVENALLDLKARLLDVSVADLLGGAVRSRLPVYFSHCGSYRFGTTAELVGKAPLRTWDDVVALGTEVRDAGWRALKTNVLALDDEEVRGRAFGWARSPGVGGSDWDDRMIEQTVRTVAALREGAGDDVAILVDVNFLLRTDGYRRLVDGLAGQRLGWLELDGVAPRALASLRDRAGFPVASGESLFGMAEYRPYLEAEALDTAIVDVVWNGVGEATRIAAMADAFGATVAPHNFYGPLATAMSAQFSAVVPNLARTEVDGDGVPWRDELLVEPLVVEDGFLDVPDGPGWGVEPDEDAIRRHPVAG
ncbi:mandelate racemase/muconate lactonizing enzyme family protein [Amnibacterium endophyticum]|uniref:Mandelate racemase/muconate lactonizing enzyme family protein n=1 Tax=Amnibacterium endophyticum TaxID=2109337 RepID=A0ABW4L9W8_9MICO